MVYEKPNWDANPPKYVGQRRYYNGREYNPARACGRCAGPFWPRRGQSRLCDSCRSCRSCAAKLPDPLRFDLCRRCRPLTLAQRAQLRRLHDGMFGQNNPAKKPGVGAKISAAISGDNHPAKKNPEWYRQHADRIRPNKVSKLEDLVATSLPGLERQYKVRWYAIDFADPVRKLAVEVQGCWHHVCQLCFPESPEHPTQCATVLNDRRKRSYLQNRGWRVIYLWEHDVRNGNVCYLEGISL